MRLALAAALLAALVVSGVPATGSETPPAGAQRYFVLLDGDPLAIRARTGPTERRAVLGRQGPVLQRARALGGKVHYRYATALNGFSAELSAEAARELEREPGVEAVLPTGIARAYNSESTDWIGATKVWKRFGYTGRGVTVAVVDTGIDYTHADFGGSGVAGDYDDNDPTIVEPGSFPTEKVVAGYDFVGDDYDVLDGSSANDVPQPDDDPLDPHGHGTHVAGTCCGEGVPGVVGKGVAPDVRIVALKVWGDGGSSTSDVLVAAYERALDPNGDGSLDDAVDVLSFSGGVDYGTSESAESVAASNVVAAGTVFVAAAGNIGNQPSGGAPYRVGAPAAAPDVIAVGASGRSTDVVTSFSSEGPARRGGLKPDVVAPGAGIVSARYASGDGAATSSGTSMAAPHVSGVAALLLDKDGTLSPDRVRRLIVGHARSRVVDLGGSLASVALRGSGRVDAFAAVRGKTFVRPDSNSWGVRFLDRRRTFSDRLWVRNASGRVHRYALRARSTADVDGAGALSLSRSKLRLEPHTSRSVRVRITVAPGAIDQSAQLARWYGEHPSVEGKLVVTRRTGRDERVSVPLYLSPVAVDAAPPAPSEVTLDGGVATIELPVARGPARDATDLYPVAGADPWGDVSPSVGADVISFGARRLDLGDLPAGTDARAGQGWQEFVSGGAHLSDPLEFAIVTSEMHHTLETERVRVFVDSGADGVYADPDRRADFMISKAVGEMEACIDDLSTAPGCSGSYPGDYPRFETDLFGLVVDAADVDAGDAFAFRVQVCGSTFSGDDHLEDLECDETDELVYDGSAPVPSAYFCKGFWDAPACGSLQVSGPGDVLLVHPTRAPGSHQLISVREQAP